MGTVTVTPTPNPTLGKVAVAVTFSDTGITTCQVERISVTTPRVTLRAGAVLKVINGQATIDDHECPFDQPVIYRATAGADTGDSAMVTLVSIGRTWLKDPAYPSRNLVLDEVTSIQTRTYAARTGVFAVIDRPRPVVVAARRQDWSGELKFVTATDDQRTKLYDLLSRGQVLLLSTPEKAGTTYGVGNLYVYVADVTEERISPVVTEQSRAWTLPITVVDRPDALATMQPLTWADVKTKYATWQALIDANLTWNRLLESAP